MKIIKDHRRHNTCVHMILVFGLLFTLLGSPKVSQAQALGTRNENAFINCAAQTQIPESECDALVVFYKSTNGANWTDHTGWMQTDTPCSWYGVYCTGGHVTQLILWDNGLSGSIPPELGSLMQLTYLELGISQLTGPIPPELGNLTNLDVLDLPDNELYGSIPAELSNLTNLNYLRLVSNQLTGTIPPELGSLTNLDTLDLGENQLTGHIPAELGNLTKLTRLLLYYNQLTGAIPPELGNLPNLEVLSLSLNQLTGAIPVEMGRLTSLTYLEINDNQLTGGIPKQLGNLTNLQYLRLSYNQLSGGIPVELGTLTKLEDLSLSGNQLTGSIPADLGNLTKLSFLILYNNQLTGNIPAELGNLTNLGHLNLDKNKLSGEIPTSITNLSSLYYLSLSCGLTSTNPTVIAFINTLVPGWQNSICPVVSSINRSYANPTPLASVDFTVTFSEPVEGVTVDDFVLYTTGIADASITGMSGMGDTYAVTVKTGSGNGDLRLNLVDDNTILGATGNSLGGPAPGDGSFTSGQTYRVIKTPTFSDVPVTHPYWEDIEVLHANGLSAGCQASPLKFCPDQIMNRGQAAVFTLRGKVGSSYVPPVPTHIFKDDWSKGKWAEPWAESMKLEGLSAGCMANPLKYCPWDQIPREQAVIFALRLRYGKSFVPPLATGTLFADMTNPGYYATAWAEQAYKDGLIPSCGMSGGKPKFCPKDLVSRGLGAYMIVRAKNLTVP